MNGLRPSPRLDGPFKALAAALVMAAPLGAQEADLAERMLRSGERAYAAKAYPEALDSWKQVVDSAPRSSQAAWALLFMARHLMDVAQQPEAALGLLDRLKQDHLTSPAAPAGLLLRGRLLARRARRAQELREAMAEWNRVVDLFPFQPEAQWARLELGQACLDLDQPDKALVQFIEPLQADPSGPQGPGALLGAALALERLGQLNRCLALLQQLMDLHPQSPQAQEARRHLTTLVRHRIQRPPLKSLGPWPQGRTKWLKTPTLLAMGRPGELFVYQDDLDQVFRLTEGQLVSCGPSGKNAKALVGGGLRGPWLMIPKQGLIRDDGSTLALPTLVHPSGGFLDRWGTAWLGDAKTPSLVLIQTDGQSRTLPSPAPSGLAPLPGGGAVVASDANRSLIFLNAQGQSRAQVPYGKDLPGAFRTVLALASDPLGHVAALVEGGDFEGVVLWGPDGALLRQASFKALGVSGRFRALVLDLEGGLILADRSNDLLLRIQ